MRNAVFPPFSSSFCSSGENDEVQLPMPNVSVDLHRLNNIGTGFFLDHVSNDLHLGSFTPLSSTTEFTHPLDLIPGGGSGYKTSSMYKDAVDIHQKKAIGVSSDQEAMRSARKRTGGNVGLSVEATSAACKKKKGLQVDDVHKHTQESSGSAVQPMKAPMRRSHKLGDRITALQQLVSPFGKTDTASVLQEATVYIKHLQEQIQVLSNPYFRFKASLHPHGGLGAEKSDLRSRGLCLVPISTTANLAKDAANINQYTPAGPSSRSS